MSRSYKVKVKSHWVYSVPQVLEHFGVCRNTLSNWVGEGLSPSPGTGPQVFRGSELNRFHQERRARNRNNLRHGQFLCTGCKAGVFPENETLSIKVNASQKTVATAACPECNGMLIKLLGATECDAMRNCLNTNTALYKIDERNGSATARIGKEHGFGLRLEPSLNDHLLHFWQIYAGRYDVKTIDAHLASIRDFEVYFDRRCFSKVTDKDTAIYRNLLVKMGGLPKEAGGLSSSSIRHRISHLRLFFVWLRKQEGYRRLSANIPDQLDLPKRQQAGILPREAKAFPTLDEAQAMVNSMPCATRLMRRDRAMVALAFLTALRAGALVTLRLKHLDIEARTVTQDGTEMRAKNGKSFVVKWFPGVECFAPFVTEWKEELEALGFREEDALFPKAPDLKRQSEEAALVLPLNSNGPANGAFAVASSAIGKSYSPHSARHFIKALGDTRCTSYDERKAWSQNMGHENEVITETYYAKMTAEQRLEVLEEIENRTPESRSPEGDIELMLGYLLKELPEGSPEYLRGKALAREREDARDALIFKE